MPGLFHGTPLERPVTCERCGRTLDVCGCPRDAAGRAVAPKDQRVRVHRERRRGKWTTVITGLEVRKADLEAMVRELRRLVAGGGTADKGEIELQGDHRERVIAWLRDRGFEAKAAGG